VLARLRPRELQSANDERLGEGAQASRDDCDQPMQWRAIHASETTERDSQMSSGVDRNTPRLSKQLDRSKSVPTGMTAVYPLCHRDRSESRALAIPLAFFQTSRGAVSECWEAARTAARMASAGAWSRKALN